MGTSKCSTYFLYIKNAGKRDLKQEERESKYQEIISSLTDKLKLIEDVKKRYRRYKILYYYKKRII